MERTMTMNRVGELVKHPELLNEDTLSMLRRLVEKYPYYQTARLLLLQNMYKLKDPLFNKELRRSAILLNDRKVLFDMIEGAGYEISPQQLHSGPIENDAEVDRTLSLINDFLEDMPLEPEPRSGKGAIPVDATTDYMAYLMQEEAQANEMETKKKELPKRSQRITLEEKEEYELPEEVDVQEEEFFTETLAQIYIKQQKYERALEIIRTLSADNPKKNSYFADQIRFLEKLIEINKNNN